MKQTSFALATIALLVTGGLSAVAQPRLASHGFTQAGAFHLTTAGPAEIETSTNLQTWTKFATVSQETTLDDVASRQMDWRFFRLRAASNMNSTTVGFTKITVAPGKMAILGNPFLAPLALDTPERRMEVFGMTNPPIKLSFYTNGNFVAHTLDHTSGAWAPALRPIRSQEGFSIENLGTRPLVVRLAGQVRQGLFNLAVPAGGGLVVPPVPQPGPVAQALGIPGKDGVQIDIFNEQTQSHQTSTYDTLENKWLPALPDYRPGRAILVKTPAALTWTKNSTVESK